MNRSELKVTLGLRIRFLIAKALYWLPWPKWNWYLLMAAPGYFIRIRWLNRAAYTRREGKE